MKTGRKFSVIIPTTGERDTLDLVIKRAKDEADEVIVEIDKPKLQTVARMNLAYKKCKGDVIISLNDKGLLMPGWRQKTEEALDKIGGSGIVNYWPNNLIGFGAYTRDFIENELGGYIAWPDYIHYWHDFESSEIANKARKYISLPEVLLFLDKPHGDKTELHNISCQQFDDETFHIRNGMGFPLVRVRTDEEIKKHL